MRTYFRLLLVLVASSPFASYAEDTNLGPLTTTFTPASTCLDVTAIVLDFGSTTRYTAALDIPVDPENPESLAFLPWMPF